MGTDKAALVLDGRPMAAASTDALARVGLDVILVGASDELARVLGRPTVPDGVAHAGPVAAIAGLADHGRDLVVLPCDLPRVDSAALEPLLAGGRPEVIRAARRNGRAAWPIGWWRWELVERLVPVVAPGATSFGRALDELAVAVEWCDVDARLDDADEPGDLERLGYPPAHD